MKVDFHYIIAEPSHNRASRSERVFPEKENLTNLHQPTEPKESAAHSRRADMTSPKITADKTNANAPQDATEVSNGNAAAAGSSADSVAAAAASAESSPGTTGPYGVFSWLKVFRFANLMIKQGC